MPFTTPQKKRAAGGTAPGAGPGVDGTAAPVAPSTPGFVDFGRILAANQPGAQRMAQGLTGKAEQAGQQASAAIDSARTGFQGKVQSGTLQYQPTTLQRTSGPASADLYRTAGAMQSQASRGYAGPKDWSAAGYDTAALATQAAKAQDTAKRLTSAGGRGAMLRETAGGSYSTGMSTLDSALAGAAMGNRGSELAELYGNLSQRLIDYQKQGGEAVGQATTTSNEAAQRYAEEAERFQTLGEDAEAQEQRQLELDRRRRNVRGGYPPGFLNRGVGGG